MTFNSPSSGGGGSRDDRQPPSSKVPKIATPFLSKIPLFQQGTTVLQGVKENVCESGKNEGVRENVKSAESEEALVAKRQAELEQAVMAGLSECGHLVMIIILTNHY